MEKLDQKKCYKKARINPTGTQPAILDNTPHHLWSDLRWVAKRKKRIQEALCGWRRLDSDSLVGRCSWKTADRSILVGFWMVRSWFFNVWEKAIWKRLKTEKKSLSWNLGEWIQKWSTPYARHEIFWILKPVEYSFSIPRGASPWLLSTNSIYL